MAELGLAIVATVDLCFKYGSQLVDLCASYKHAKDELAERVVRLESIWIQTSSQLRFLRSVWETLEESHQRNQSQVIQILAGKLKIVTTRIRSLLEQNASTPSSVKVKKWKYALLKEGLDKSIDDLESWRKIFDPSWFLIMKTTGRLIDLELSNSNEVLPPLNPIASARVLRNALQPLEDSPAKIFLPIDGLNAANITDIPFSPVRLAQRYGSSRWLLLDHAIQPEHVNPNAFAEDIRDIARKLLHVDPLTFRLFACSGVVRSVDTLVNRPSFTFVFKMPEGYANPRSLRQVLQDVVREHSLSERFQIARDLARAVSYVHSFGFVHKNIRPETIIMLTDDTSHLGSPFLAGFEAFRAVGRGTARKGDTSWNQNLYRHPGRQGESPQDDYVMQHDIYSLGVCLLELGLFQTFVNYDESDQPSSTWLMLKISAEELQLTNYSRSKDILVSIARQHLPKCMGDRYTAVVVTCLTCLDRDNADFGDKSEFQDEDGILVNVRYIEKVLFQLNEIIV